MDATVDEHRLRGQIEQLEQKLAVAEQAWQAGVGSAADIPTPLFVPDDVALRPSLGGDSERRAWRRIQTLQGMLRSRRQALAYLLAHPNRELVEWQERLRRDQQRVADAADRVEQVRAQLKDQAVRRRQREATGERVSGTRPVPVEEHTRLRAATKALHTAIARAKATTYNRRPHTAKVNTTDPASRIMPGKKHDFDQRHTAQLSACRGQFILAVGLHDSTHDKKALVALLAATRANLDAAGISEPIGTALFDAGYASEANFTADLPVWHLLVAVTNEARQSRRRTDPAAALPDAWTGMAAQFDDPATRKLYKQRSAIIEPVFAQLFCRFGTLINQRGDDVLTELQLRAATHNFLKIHRHQARRGD